MHSNHKRTDTSHMYIFFCGVVFCQGFCFPTPLRLQQSELGIGRF
ncbi:hypothetical protein PVAP13_9NG669814 [Panicum virgatum]|uniref:Uncharacterized protein n=1 Tax=Panicum virgatum TaxID=38727 RepID=A0A8T0MYH7_PANVG|nr:hypothetical protein PVAP13_9NG669814 [Panicum virgatum]